MFDFIRRHKRLVLIFLTVLIVPSFVVFGVHGWQESAHDRNTIAHVGDQTVTRQEFDTVLRDQTERMRQMFGGAVDTRQINTPEMRQAVLDNLIQQRALTQETLKKHLSVSDEQVREALLSIPAIAQLRKPDGSFDEAAYTQLLAAQQLTPQRLEAQIRFELASQQLPSNVQVSASVPKAVIDRFAQLRAQVREVSLMMIPANTYASKIHPTQAQLQAYYDAHKAEFQTPESAKVEYVTLDPKAMPANAVTQPSDDDLKKRYQENAARFTTEEQRRVSHILIAAPADASPADRAKAKAKADALLAQLHKQPNDFAKLAMENSEDPGSKAKGGDLGYFGRGTMVGPFENAAFAMKDGDLSDVVKTDFGFHILKLTGIKPAQTKPFGEVKDELASEWRQQQQAKDYAKLADQFTNTVYEQPDSLQPVADKLALKVQTGNVGRTPNPALGQSPLNNEKLLRAIFGDEALKNKRNTEAVDVGQGVLVSARVVEYHPAATPALSAIEPQVSAKVVAELAAQEAKQAGEAKLEALKKGGVAADGFGPVQAVSRDNPGQLPPAALNAIFAADTKTLPAYAGVDLGAQGYAVYRISQVSQTTAQDPQRIAAESQQLHQITAQAEWNAYVASLRARSKVKIQQDVTKSGS